MRSEENKSVFILVGGWLRDEKTYEKLKRTAPGNVDFYFVHYKHLKHPSFSGDLLKFTKDSGLEKVNLIGHSTGGALCIDFAIKNPHKVRRLYLVDSEGVYGKEKSWEIFVNLIKSNLTRRKFFQNVRSTLHLIKSPFLHFRFAKYAHFADFIFDNFDVETSIIWGERDTLIPLWQGKVLHKLIKNSDFHVLKEYDHDWLFLHPEKFWEIVKNK